MMVCVSVVPPPVSGLRRVEASESSLSLEWSVPVVHNQYKILDYELRYSPEVYTHACITRTSMLS